MYNTKFTTNEDVEKISASGTLEDVRQGPFSVWEKGLVAEFPYPPCGLEPDIRIAQIATKGDQVWEHWFFQSNPSIIWVTLVIYPCRFNKLRAMGMTGCYPVYHFTGRALRLHGCHLKHRVAICTLNLKFLSQGVHVKSHGPDFIHNLFPRLKCLATGVVHDEFLRFI
jgi:hypothetical protein